MKFTRILLGTGLALIASTGLMAQEKPGDLEIGFMGMLASSSTSGGGGSTSFGDVSGQFGMYITKNLEVAIGPTVSIMSTPNTSGSGSTSKTTFGSSVSATWSFLAQNAKMVPYAGLALYKHDFSDSNEKLSFGVQGGFKYFFTPKAAFNVGLNYLVASNSYDNGLGGTTTVTTSTILAQVGLSYLF